MMYGKKRDEDGGVPPMRPLTKPLIPRASDKASKRKPKASSPQARARNVRPLIRDFLRKEVIQPQVPLRLPCYDFTPVADPTVVACLLTVSKTPSGKANSHGVTGGVYKARERIHRGVLIRDY
jgi:hypothetical protein